MFSGIVEEYATLVALVKDQENIHFTFKCSFVNELKIDQSISHNGVCLTVVSLTDDTYTVTAMKETLERSNLGLLKVGDKVNVIRQMILFRWLSFLILMNIPISIRLQSAVW